MKKLLAILLTLLLASVAGAANKVRVFAEVNLTPVYGPNVYYSSTQPVSPTNPAWVQNQPSSDYMLGLGYAPFTMVYNGTLNRLNTWHGQDQKLIKGGSLFWTNPLTGASNDINLCDPPDDAAVRFVSALHRTNPYGGCKQLLVPICFDIENAQSLEVAAADTRDTMEAKARVIAGAIQNARSYAGGGPDTDCWWYGFPSYPPAPPISDVLVAAKDRYYLSQVSISEAVTHACCSFYNWDVSAVNTTSWYTMPAAMDGVIAGYYPRLLKAKVAFICPFYQIYWPANAPPGVAAKNNTPVEYAAWCRQVDYLVENGWDIVVWVGNQRHEPVIAHLAYVAKYRRN